MSAKTTNKQVVTTCGAIVQDSAGKILILLRSASDTRRPVRWDLPGGHAEEGEALEQTLSRELREETGLVVTEKPELLFAHSALFEDVSVNWLFFAATIDPTDITLSSEHSEYRWVTLDEAAKLIDYEPKRKAVLYLRDKGLLSQS